jgi:predicted Zn-dependent protease
MKKGNQNRNEAAEAVFQEALQLRSKGKLDDAEKLLSGLVQASPEDTEAFLILGAVLYAQDNYFGALSAFGRVLDEMPMHEPSSLGLFHSLWALGQRKEAFAEMKRFLSVANSQEYERILSDIDRAMEQH